MVLASQRARATIAAVEGGVLVSSGLQLELLEADGGRRWSVDVPFKVHAAKATQGAVGLLAAHGFYLVNTNDGSMVNEGRSAPGGFSDLARDQAVAGRLQVAEGDSPLFTAGSWHPSRRQRTSTPVGGLVGQRALALAGSRWPPLVRTIDGRRPQTKAGGPFMELVFDPCRGSTVVAEQRWRAVGGRSSSLWLGHAQPVGIRQPRAHGGGS